MLSHYKLDGDGGIQFLWGCDLGLHCIIPFRRVRLFQRYNISRSHELISRSDDLITRSDELISRSDDLVSCFDDIISRSDDLLSRSDNIISRSDDLTSRGNELLNKISMSLPGFRNYQLVMNTYSKFKD